MLFQEKYPESSLAVMSLLVCHLKKPVDALKYKKQFMNGVVYVHYSNSLTVTEFVASANIFSFLFHF